MESEKVRYNYRTSLNDDLKGMESKGEEIIRQYVKDYIENNKSDVIRMAELTLVLRRIADAYYHNAKALWEAGDFDSRANQLAHARVCENMHNELLYRMIGKWERGYINNGVYDPGEGRVIGDESMCEDFRKDFTSEADEDYSHRQLPALRNINEMETYASIIRGFEPTEREYEAFPLNDYDQ